MTPSEQRWEWERQKAVLPIGDPRRRELFDKESKSIHDELFDVDVPASSDGSPSPAVG